MGLNMCLYREHCLTRHSDPELLEVIKKTEKFKNYDNFTIRAEVAYWSKANQIHRWFVDNVQDGVDDCREMLVNIGQLSNLLTTVIEVLNNGTKKFALEKLPPSSGYFFGSETIGQRYWESLKDTKRMLKKVLKSDTDDASYFYCASW